MGAARVPRGKIARPVPAKVTAPEITGYFPRKRLFRLLDSARKRPVVWVSAPPGSGKTTLVSSYLDVRRLPRLWYQVDERDADVATFFYYMGLAAQKAAPRKRKPMPLLTPEYFPGLPVFTRRFFDELFARLPTPSVVVLDNYQKIPPESTLHDVIRDAAACLPPKVTLLLVSRSAPPPAFAPLSANRLSSVLEWEEMRLTVEETKGIARRHGRRPFRAEEIRRIGESADGWVAGLVLMLEKAAAGGVVPEGKGTRTPEEIVDYFGGEVFGQADPDTRSFLLASSFLPRMTAEMAERLTGYARAGAILSALCRNNWFTQARGHGDPVYEYHALFREFLLSRAKDRASGGGDPAVAAFRGGAAGGEGTGGGRGGPPSGVRRLGRVDPHRSFQCPVACRPGKVRTLEEWLRALPERHARRRSVAAVLDGRLPHAVRSGGKRFPFRERLPRVPETDGPGRIVPRLGGRRRFHLLLAPRPVAAGPVDRRHRSPGDGVGRAPPGPDRGARHERDDDGARAPAAFVPGGGGVGRPLPFGRPDERRREHEGGGPLRTLPLPGPLAATSPGRGGASAY